MTYLQMSVAGGIPCLGKGKRGGRGGVGRYPSLGELGTQIYVGGGGE